MLLFIDLSHFINKLDGTSFFSKRDNFSHIVIHFLCKFIVVKYVPVDTPISVITCSNPKSVSTWTQLDYSCKISTLSSKSFRSYLG